MCIRNSRGNLEAPVNHKVLCRVFVHKAVITLHQVLLVFFLNIHNCVCVFLKHNILQEQMVNFWEVV